MNKLNYKEIVDILIKNKIKISDISYDYFLLKDKIEQLVGEVKQVVRTTSNLPSDLSSDLSSDYEIIDEYELVEVYHFIEHDVYMKLSGIATSYYVSFIEEKWDNKKYVNEVKPISKTITVYEEI